MSSSSRLRRLVAAAVVTAVVAVIVATAAVGTPAASAVAPTIVSFWLLNATSGAWGTRLHDGATIDADVLDPYAITAVSSAGTSRSVVYTAPARYAHVEKAAPYTLAWDVGGVDFRPVRLRPGAHTVSAYVAAAPDGHDGAGPPLSVSFTVVRGGEERGGGATAPAPSKPPPAPAVDPSTASPAPTVAPAAGFVPLTAADDLPVPTRAPRCGVDAPTITSVSSGITFYSRVNWIYSVDASYCNDAANRFRMQVFAAPSDGSGRVTRLFQSVEAVNPLGGSSNYPSMMFLELQRSCAPQIVFSVLCVGPPSAGGPPSCTRSEVRNMVPVSQPGVSVGTPRLPPAVALAPGDAFSLAANVSALYDGQDALETPPELRLVAVVRRADNSTIRGPPVVGSEVITVDLLAGGVTLADDGATVSVEYSRAACPTDLGTPVGTIAGTRLSVSATTESLVRQDVGVPTITSLTYPPTPAGEPVNVSVEASQPAGRGARRAADGSLRPTALTYQWFLKDREFSEQGASDPSPLAGATGPVLRLDEARCNNFLGCGRYGCSQRVQYQVDVCNTSGCVRSEIIQPVVQRPADEALAQELMNNGQCMEFSE